MQVIAASTGLRKEPHPLAALENELLFGEHFVPSSHKLTDEGVLWHFGRAQLDGYEGWVDGRALTHTLTDPTHYVCTVRTTAYQDAGFKTPVILKLSVNTPVTVLEEAESDEGVMARLANAGWVFKDQLQEVGKYAKDPVTEALKLLGTPYLWGGRDTTNGVDCSALVQHALQLCGIPTPRDTGPQWESDATGVRCDELPPARGQLIFWPGHVGILVSDREVIHASIYARRVAVESLATAIADRREPLGRKRLY